MLGVVEALDPGWLGDVLQVAVAVDRAAVLIQAANAGMVGHHAHVYTLATHRQIPRGSALAPALQDALDRDRRSSACSRSCCCCRWTSSCWRGMFAYGALIAFALAHLSVVRLRFKEPDRRRPFKVPLNVRVRGRELPLPAALGARAVDRRLDRRARLPRRGALLGTAWMVFGLASTSSTARAGPFADAAGRGPGRALAQEPEVEYGSILVPVFGSDSTTTS